MIDLTFFTAANQEYEPFVIPHIYSALRANEDARIEVCLERPKAFEAANPDAMSILYECFGRDRILLRGADWGLTHPNTVRFLEEPIEKTKYTYISDVDILNLQPIKSWHLEHMKELGMPYYNTKRKGQQKLTGLHFTETDWLYPIATQERALYRTATDEFTLYKIVESRGLPMKEDLSRPIFGLHFSINQLPLQHGAPCWGVNSKGKVDLYVAMKNEQRWKDIFQFLDLRYRLLLFLFDCAANCVHEGYGHKPSNELKTLYRGLA